MCGIFGICRLDRQSIDLKDVQQAVTTLRHRGPDDEGYLLANTQTGQVVPCSGKDTDPRLGLPRIEESVGKPFDVVLGHRRLAIIDLSIAGHQPMRNARGSLWIVFNGEIYNYRELRDELKARGHAFRTYSDTEVILSAYEEWAEACLERFNGMWAFVIWDTRRRLLFCSRDRFGVKPFYYYWDGRTFLFASEIKGILASGAVEVKPNPPLIYDFLAHGLVDHSEETFFAKIRRLEAGHYLRVTSDRQVTASRYYLFPRSGPSEDVEPKDPEKAARVLLDLLTDAVRLRLRADVPVGSCLSGGLDSSTIVCLMNRLLRSEDASRNGLGDVKQKTFTSAFVDSPFDERQFSDKVIQVTNAEPHCVFPDGHALWKELDRLLRHQEEPFGSTSIYAQWNVMRLVREKGVTVVLDGQGGDELFAGYQPYYGFFLASLLKAEQPVSFIRELWFIRGILNLSLRQTMRRAASAVLHSMPTPIQSAVASIRKQTPGPSRFLREEFARLYRERGDRLTTRLGANLAEQLWNDVTTFSLPQLLRYEDKNSMAFSVEARVPFLDVRVAEFAAKLPVSLKIRDGWTKSILRQATAGILPEEVRWRRDKKGFPTPEYEWWSLNTQGIRELFEHSKSIDFIRTGAVLRAFSELLADRCGGFALWRFVCLEKWMRVWMPERQGVGCSRC